MTTDKQMTPEELCLAYRAELERLYGKERAEKSHVSHYKGWFYIAKAIRYSDNSVGHVGPVSAYRKKQVLEMLETLRGRESK